MVIYENYRSLYISLPEKKGPNFYFRFNSSLYKQTTIKCATIPFACFLFISFKTVQLFFYIWVILILLILFFMLLIYILQIDHYHWTSDESYPTTVGRINLPFHSIKRCTKAFILVLCWWSSRFNLVCLVCGQLGASAIQLNCMVKKKDLRPLHLPSISCR